MKAVKGLGYVILIGLTVPGVIGLWQRSQTGLMETHLTNHVGNTFKLFHLERIDEPAQDVATL